MNEQKIAIILFGGRGMRFGKPKQFADIAGKSMLERTLTRISGSGLFDSILLLVASKEMEETKKALSSFAYATPLTLLCGGECREASVKNALEHLKANNIPDSSIILVHDGARPFTSEAILRENIQRAAKLGAAVTAIKSTSSLFLSKGEGIDGYLDREEVYEVQTPQTFRFSVLRSSFDEETDLSAFTDDASIVLAHGHDVSIVLGDKANIKITTPEDLFLLGL